MVQIQSTENISDNGKGQTAFKTFLRYFIAAMLLLEAFLGFSGTNIHGGALYVVAAIIYILFVNNIAWSISNNIRKWVMPEAYLASDATDAFRKKNILAYRSAMVWSNYFMVNFNWFGRIYFADNLCKQ